MRKSERWTYAFFVFLGKLSVFNKERKKMTQQSRGRSFMASILSLSLLTVMAGAVVAPALGVIQAYFDDSNQLFVQMIVSIPAIFIVITNII